MVYATAGAPFTIVFDNGADPLPAGYGKLTVVPAA